MKELNREEKERIAELIAEKRRRLKSISSEERLRNVWIAKCRSDLTLWTVEAQRHKGYKPAAHHRLLISKLEEVAAGTIPRLMVFMPPGSAKSSYASKLFPAWMLRRGVQIIGASHTVAPLALKFSAEIQDLVRENQEVLGYGLRSENVQMWRTTNGGQYLAAGVGTAIPGFRADLGIIDDPIKSRQAADSETDRQRVWEWYIGSFERRLTPGASIILILTRWHEDDLAGRLLEVQGDQWEVLKLPAEAEAGDQLGRQPGEWLWEDDDYGYGAELASIKDNLEAAGATREWASQYQQRPRPLEGSIFRTDRIGVLPAPPAGGRTVRAYDLAATKDTGTRDQAWTRGVKLTLLDNKRLVVEDVVGCRGGPDDVERLIFNTAGQDGRKVTIGLPQDPGQAGKAQVAYFAKLLHGYPIESSPETGDKATRAAPVASQVNVGNVDVVAGPWNRSFLDELAAFPSGATKDQVDALSRGYAMLIERGRPLILSSKALDRFRVPTQNRFASAGRDRFARAR
jgi:predicted phage terminase large subunit-like protein